MKLHRLLLPVLGAICLIITPASSFADHRVTVYRDRDGDGRFNRKRIEVPHCYNRGGPAFFPGYRGFGNQPFGYGFGPALGFSVNRSFRTPTYSRCSDDLAVDVQRELRRRGYYRGAIDGDVGPGTRSAIYYYQADRGLSRTGRIDRTLLRSLGIG